MSSFDAIPYNERIIVALDCGADEALEIATSLQGSGATWMKIGMTLYYAEGPAIVKRFKDMGFNVFLDLKFHDIPHQVQGAARSAVSTGADMLTMHAVGGVEMMRAAKKGAAEALEGTDAPEPVTLGITVLTSMDQETLAATGVTRTVAEQVTALAGQVREAGLSGVVCSPLEAAQMRELLGPDAYIVTPGVRPANAEIGDQKRVFTPQKAFEAGASHLVIGRPITKADDPAQAFRDILASLDEE